MKSRLLAAAKAKAKELQQDAADRIERIDKVDKVDRIDRIEKAVRGDGATLESDDDSEAPRAAPDDPPTSQGDERAAS